MRDRKVTCVTTDHPKAKYAACKNVITHLTFLMLHACRK